ncbi:MAG: hypothetical protein KDC66_08980 [Phaeodactylibacter sp.]|nr:hypothetical protein [Phaeodactylibacter sp.]MCB9275031.1 hypothetical protein [Lewinellaceae bacterium]
MTPLIIHDETADGTVLNQVYLLLEHHSITVEELLRMRIAQEAKDFDAANLKEALLQRQKAGAHIALRAFREHGFTIYIDNRRVERLEEEVEISANTQVRFVQCAEKHG